MLTMYGQENLFNSVSLIISPHPSPISPSSYFICESPIPELSVFTLHYSDGLPFHYHTFNFLFSLHLVCQSTKDKGSQCDLWK